MIISNLYKMKMNPMRNMKMNLMKKNININQIKPHSKSLFLFSTYVFWLFNCKIIQFNYQIINFQIVLANKLGTNSNKKLLLVFFLFHTQQKPIKVEKILL